MKSRLSNPFRAIAHVTTGFALSMSLAPAATQIWDNGASNLTWNTVSTNWDAGSAWTNDNDAVFDATGVGAITNTGVSAGSLTFNTGGYAITGGTLTLTGTTPTITTNAAATISSALGGGAGLTKAGSGTLTLSGSNGYTGSTTINAGTLQIANSGALPAGAALNLTASGAKLTLGVPGEALAWTADSAVADSQFSAAYVPNLAIDGNTGTRWASNGPLPNWIYADLGSVRNIGQCKINWEAAYSTSFTIQVSDDATNWTDATGTLNAGGAGLKTYNLNAATSGQYVRMYSTAGRYGGSSLWEMQAVTAASGAGTYSISSLSGVAGSVVDLLGIGSTLMAGSGNADTTFAGSMLGGTADSFVKEGTGTLTWVGVTGYQVAPTVTDGTLKIDLTAGGGELTLPGTTVMVQENGTLELLSGDNTGADSTFFRNGTITGNGTLTKTGAGYIGFLFVNNTGVRDFTGLIDVREGTLANNGTAWAAGAGLMDLNVAAGAQFDLRTQNVKIDELSGAGLIARSWTGTATLIVGNNDGSATFSGILQNLRPEGSNGGVLAFTKNGSGTQTLSGDCTYSGATTVNAGTLIIDGSLGIGSTVTVKDGATLAGGGTVDGPVIVQSGGTLAGTGTLNDTISVTAGAFLSPAGQGNTGTMTLDGTLSLVGTLQMDLQKSGATLTNDQLAGIGEIAVSGSLAVTASGDPLALGDEFQIFDVVGEITGGFSGQSLPVLATGLSWDTSNLLTTGVIRVADSVAAPLFSPPSGGYVGTPAVTITSDSGSTIYYTLNGSPPTTFSPNGPSPLNLGALPANTANHTIKAFAAKAGQANSPVVTATYNTVSTPTWNVDDNGLWSEADKWLNQVIPNGVGATADFNALPQTADSMVTLDTDRTVGGLIFGNTNEYNWTLDATGPSTLTLATLSGAPVVQVLNQTATISAPLAGNQGLAKTGDGTLNLSRGNAYTGPTTVTGGTLSYRGPQYTSFATSSLDVAAGATAEFRNSGDAVLAAPITGSGTVLAAGGGESFRPSGDNSGFTGTFETADGGSHDFVNSGAQGWSANAAYVHNGPYIRFYGSSAGQTADFGSLSGTNPASAIATWADSATSTTTIRVGALNTDTTYAGIIKNVFYTGAAKMALTKVGTGTLTLTGTSTYTGPTMVNAGTLEVDGSLAAGSAVTLASGATLAGIGTVNGTVGIPAGAFVAPGGADLGILTLGTATAGGTYQCQLDATGGDLLAVTGTLTVDAGTQITFTGTPAAASYTILTYGTLVGDLPAITPPDGYTVNLSTPGEVTLVKGGGYGAWAEANAPGQTMDQDHDHDGVANGIEYFMGLSGSGFTANPAIAGNGGISWPMGAAYTGTYGSDYVVQTSEDLVNWDPVDQADVTIDADSVDYTLPKTHPKGFTRLQVTGP